MDMTVQQTSQEKKKCPGGSPTARRWGHRWRGLWATNSWAPRHCGWRAISIFAQPECFSKARATAFRNTQALQSCCYPSSEELRQAFDVQHRLPDPSRLPFHLWC